MADENDIRIERELLEIQRERAAALQQEKAILEANNKLNVKGKEILQMNLDLSAQELEVTRMTYGALKDAQTAIAAGSTLEEINIKLKRKGLEYSEEALAAAEIELGAKKDSLRTQRQANTAAATLLKRTAGISDAWKGSATGAVMTGVASGKLGASLKGLLDPMDLLMSAFSKIVEMSMIAAAQYDSMSASIRKIAGADSDLAANAYESHRAMLEFGVSIDEAGASAQALYRDMAIFSHSLEADQNLLRDQAALLNEVGVEFGTTAKMMNILDKGLGMSAPEIKDYTAKLYDMSEQLKVPPDVIFKDWQASSKELMKYGDGMVDVLEGLEHQSKNTGLAVGDLLGIAKQFDQFDTAGEAVGRLNAILGGPYLNAIDMVYMTEDQRIEALRETISLSGQVWKDMGRHEQQAIATAAGISDMAVAAQLFGGTQSEFTDAAANQEALQKRAIAAQSAMDQMKNAFMGFAIAVAPVVDVLTKVATQFAKFMSAGNGTVGVIMSIGAALLFVTGLVMSYQQAMVAMSVVQGLATAQKKAAMAAELAAGLVKKAAIEQEMRQAIALQHQSGALAVNTALKEHSAAQEGIRTAMTNLGTTANVSFAASLQAVAIGFMKVAGVAAIAIGTFMFFDKILGMMGPKLKIFTGIVLVLAAAWALKYAIVTAGFGLPVLAAAAAGAGMLAAGFKGVVQGVGEFHDGGVVQGIRGEDKQATLAAGETVLPTHKKSDDQAVADAEAKGQLSLTKDKGFEEVTQAINNLVAKLNTMITQSEERAKGAGKEKAVEVTMELDRDKVGEATASWLEEKYGWTGA